MVRSSTRPWVASGSSVEVKKGSPLGLCDRLLCRRVIVECCLVGSWHIHGAQYAQGIAIEAFEPKLLRAAMLFEVIRAVALKALGHPSGFQFEAL
jgi:hypothetical protein